MHFIAWASHDSYPTTLMKAAFFCLMGLLPASSARAATIATPITGTWTGSATIPDNNDVGFSSSLSLSLPEITMVESVSFQMVINGGWNGDLYAYLIHDGGFVVLLNRPGRSLANPDGAGSSGMTVDFSDTAAQDIHVALPFGGTPSGSYQPDGRATDPLLVLDTDARTSYLSVFNGHSAGGQWTLFLADQSAGEVSTLQSWTLSLTVVPEPSGAILMAMSVVVIALSRRRVMVSFPVSS